LAWHQAVLLAVCKIEKSGYDVATFKRTRKLSALSFELSAKNQSPVESQPYQ